MAGYIGRDEQGRYVDDDKALANGAVVLGESILELIEVMEAGGLSYTADLGPLRATVEETVAQLRLVNERKGKQEDIDTWLDGG